MFRHPRGGRAPADRAPRPFPVQPYSTNPSDRRRGSPSAQAHAWRSAARDDFDDAIDSLKASLPNLPKSVADPLWNDFLSWLLTFPAGSKFSRTASIPDVTAKFRSLYDPALAAAKEAAESAAAEEADSHDALVSKSLKLSRLGKLIASLERDIVNPPPGRDPTAIEAELAAARSSFSVLDDEIDSLEAGAVPPPSVIDDPFESAADFIPLEGPAVQPWPQENFEDFISRTDPLFPPPAGKAPLDSLIVSMKVQTDSKILLPRPLELYSESEINSAKPKNRSPWYNRHEDSLEAVKCWSLETFRHVYSRPGFHFMIARTAQSGAQSRDSKLPSLRSKLSSRWGCIVDISAMDPRQDWMLCTIPDVSGPRSEILTTALMRLSEGNASYIVRHFAPISTVRDLLFTIRGSRDDANSVYNQLRKCLLEFESRGVHLGWRVLGVRKTAAPSQYRGTFILDSPDVFWPWSFSFDHDHGTINPSSPLLNFDPPWYAWKPYACQVCYSSSHPTYECALQFVRLGGVQIVSHTSLEAMKVKKAAERLIIVDKSLVPKKPAPMAPPPAPAQQVSSSSSARPPAPLSPVTESPHIPSMSWQESLTSFIASKLSRHVGHGPGLVPVSNILRLATCGSLAGTLDSLEVLIPSVSSWSRADALREFSTWQSSQTVLESLQSEDPMSLGPSAAPSVRAPSPAPLFFERSRLVPSVWLSPLDTFLAPVPPSPALSTAQPVPAPGPRTSGSAALQAHDMAFLEALANAKSSGSFAPSQLAPPMLPSSPWAPSPDDGPRLDADWHRKPDPPATSADFDLAIRAIGGDPLTINDFPLRPAPVSVSASMVDALPPSAHSSTVPGHFPAAPSPHSALPSILSSWEPTPAPAASSSLPPAPTGGPLDSAPPEPRSLRRNLSTLRAAFPAYDDNFLLAALEESGDDTAAALVWLGMFRDGSKIHTHMSAAFPDASSGLIRQLIISTGGDPSAMWNDLSRKFRSTWSTSMSASLFARNTERHNILIDDADSDVSDIIVASQGLRDFEASWWQSYALSRRHRVPPALFMEEPWSDIVTAASICAPLPPRFCRYIANLGCRHSDKAAFDEAVAAISSLKHYDDVCTMLTSHVTAAQSWLPILLEDGIIAPEAALWLATASPREHHSLFMLFERSHLAVCKDRRKMLKARSANPNSSDAVPGQDIIFLSPDEEGASDVDPDVEMVDAPRREKTRSAFGLAKPKGYLSTSKVAARRSANEVLMANARASLAGPSGVKPKKPKGSGKGSSRADKSSNK